MRAAATDVVILCGGLGTRLGEAGGGLPKPMVPIQGRPFLDILLERISRQGFRRCILCVGYRAAAVARGLRGTRGLELVFSEEPEPLGTAGALRRAARLVRSADSLVCNGDSYCPLDLVGLLRFSVRSGGAGAIAVVPADGRRDAGRVEFGAGGRITAFREKARTGDAGFISAGVYAFSRAVYGAIPARKPCSLEREVFPALLKGRGLYALVCRAPLSDIGTPARLAAFREAFSRRSRGRALPAAPPGRRPPRRSGSASPAAGSASG